MSERDELLLLVDIKTAIHAILNYTKDYSFTQYESDLKTRHAVERNFEIIGEAASRMKPDFIKHYKHVEWRILKDFRNFIIHDYFGINHDIVWETIKNRLPGLFSEIDKIIEEFK